MHSTMLQLQLTVKMYLLLRWGMGRLCLLPLTSNVGIAVGRDRISSTEGGIVLLHGTANKSPEGLHASSDQG